MQTHFEKEDAKYSRPKDENYVKVNYLKLSDGETIKMRFLQELDEDSPGFNKDAGQGFIAVEHQAGANFKIRGLCSKEDEHDPCYGCEQNNIDYKAGWKQKSKLYINVLAVRANGDEEVAVLSQGNGPKSVTPWLLEYAADNGSITGQWFKMKRKGSGQTDTAYTLTPGPFDKTPYDVTQHELINLDACVRDVPYEDQPAFYAGGQSQAPVQDESSDEPTNVKW